MTERRKILLVEDNPADAGILEHVLRDVRRSQFTLVRVGRLDEGLGRALSDAFDILLLDLNLPDSQGIATVERTCRELPGLPVIVLTGVDDEDMGVQALHRGAQDYLVKGESDGWATWRAIRYAIERSRAQAALAESLQLLGLRTRRLESDLAGTAADLQEEVRKRLQAEELLRESERLCQASLAELTNVYATAPIGLAFMDRDFRFVRINERLAAINGRPASDHIGRTLRELLPDLADAIEPLCRRVLRGEVVVDVEIRGVTAAGPREPRDWLTSCYPVKPDGGDVIGIGAVVQDITERKRMDRSLRDARSSLERRNAELRELAIQLCRAEQRERERMAQVLHDDLQQLLCAAQLSASVFLKKSGRADMEQIANHVEGLLGRSLEITRSLASELVPPVLKEHGLTAALEWLSGQMEQMHGLTVRLQAAPGAAPQPPDIQAVLYQCVRELLFNVVKHAKVKSATVRVDSDQCGIRIEVCDEGVGFSPEGPLAGRSSSPGFGLRAIRERLELLGGRLTVASRPGHGSRFALSVPAQPCP